MSSISLEHETTSCCGVIRLDRISFGVRSATVFAFQFMKWSLSGIPNMTEMCKQKDLLCNVRNNLCCLWLSLTCNVSGFLD